MLFGERMVSESVPTPLYCAPETGFQPVVPLLYSQKNTASEVTPSSRPNPVAIPSQVVTLMGSLRISGRSFTVSVASVEVASGPQPLLTVARKSVLFHDEPAPER